MKRSEAIVLYADSERNSNMYYATRFLAPDPFIFVQVDGRKMIGVSDLELGRARKEADVHEVLRLSEVDKRIGKKRKTAADYIAHILRAHGAKSVTVPPDFWHSVARGLRNRGFTVAVREEPFWPGREVKSPAEVKAIVHSLRAAEAGIGEAVDVLRKATVRGGFLYHRGEVVTSEFVRSILNVAIVRHNCFPSHSIVAGGDQACDPHNAGSGPLKAGRAIVMDVFPRSLETLYWGDITRTVVRGKPSRKLRALYDAVLKAQEFGISQIKAGADGGKIHKDIVRRFDDMGYKTGRRNGKMAGFFHGTGHGVGLDIHEMPRVGARGSVLKKGAVVTVEPGLYYFGVGGIRIEDTVLVEKNGCRPLSTFPKFFEL